MWPSKTFVRRMIDLLCCFQTKDHPIRLNQEFHRDLLWWHHFNHLPITDSLMLVIWRSLDQCIADHCMFWAACTLGYFGFLRAAEFTVPHLASFSPLVHLTVQGIAVDAPSSTSCLRIQDGPLPHGIRHPYWPWSPSTLCCACHDDISLSERQYSRAFVLRLGWSTAFSWNSH